MRSALLLSLLVAVSVGAQPRSQLIAPDTLFFAEGISSDPRTGTLFVTSIHHRSVWVTPSTGAGRWLFDPAVARTAAVTGVVIDTVRALAWIATGRHPQMRPLAGDTAVLGELLAIRLADGLVQQRYRLGDGRSLAGELTITPRGDVLISDGLRGVLYRLRHGATVLETIRSTALRSPQGIASDGTGAVAWIADWSRGLLRWDLRTDSITPVRIGHDATVRGIDGLVRVGRTLLTVYNGGAVPRVFAFTLDSAGTAAPDVRVFDSLPAFPGEPTVGTVVGDEYVYVISSAWPFYTEDGARRPGPRALPPAIVRRVPLPSDHERR